jgi:methionyl-tRNA formyltransferase
MQAEQLELFELNPQPEKKPIVFLKLSPEELSIRLKEGAKQVEEMLRGLDESKPTWKTMQWEVTI